MSRPIRSRPLVGVPVDARGGLREVAALAAPVVLQHLSATAMMVVDSALVGRLGPTQLAAVGFGGVWLWTIFSLFYGAAGAVQTFVSQYEGSGRTRECGRWAWQALACVVPPCAVLALVVWPWVDDLLALAVPSEPLREAAAGYVVARLPGEAAMACMLVFTAFLRGLGDTRTPMLVSIGANLLNGVLDYGLIFGRLGLPELGIAGAGLATSLASLAGAGALLAIFLSRRLDARFGTRPVRLERADLKRLLRIGLPMGGQWCIGSTTFAFFTTLIARMGDESMAASQAFVVLLHLSFMPALGISAAAQTLVGRNIGSGHLEAVTRSLRSALALGLGVTGVVAVVFVAIPAPLLAIFTDDPVVLALGVPLLLIGAFFQIFDGINVITEGALRGAGDTRWPFLIHLVTGWGVFIPLAWALGVWLEGGLAGAWLGGLASLVLSASIMLWRFASGAWRSLSI